MNEGKREAAGAGAAPDRAVGQSFLAPSRLPDSLSAPDPQSALLDHTPRRPLDRTRIAASIRMAGLGDSVRAAFDEERARGRLFALWPVGLAIGIGFYFALPREPWLPAILLAAAAAGGLALRRDRHDGVWFALAALACIACGIAAAQIRVLRVAAPMLPASITGEVTGIVTEVERNKRGDPRYTLRPTAIAGLPDTALPRRIRISVAQAGPLLRPGDGLVVKARLQALPGPAYPGAYDFAFHAWFEGIGGSGYAIGPPRVAAVPPDGIAERVEIAINRLRADIAARIRADLPGDTGDLTVALVTGERAGLSSAMQDDLRLSGLSHVLSISGLHMVLVSGTALALVRFGLALRPSLALRYPVRKIAAGTAFVVATGYLAIAGGQAATTRSWVMIAVVLLAVILDRQALTVRNVALAAMLILLATPEALLMPGFQMSFAAAGALVAVYGRWTRWRSGRRAIEGRKTGRWVAALAIGPRYLVGIAATSLVAGTATAPFALYHFHQFTPYGVVGNLLAIPLVSAVVMPGVLLATLSMPFGIDWAFLSIVDRALRGVLWIAAQVAGLPGADTAAIGCLPAAFPALAGLALMIAVALHTRLVALSLVPAALLFALPPSGRVPDLLIGEDGRTLAFRDEAGRLVLPYPRRNRFMTDIWLGAYSGNRQGTAPHECGKDVCSFELRDGSRVAVVWAPARLSDACGQADILAAPRLHWVRCTGRQPSVILKRSDFETSGSHALSIAPPGEPPSQPSPAEGGAEMTTAPARPERYRIEVARGRDHRPWTAARPPYQEPPSRLGASDSITTRAITAKPRSVEAIPQ